jgi:SOS regulatory protein LexA
MPTNPRAVLRTFYRNHKRLPSYREAAALFGFRSTKSAYRLVGTLIDEGLIAKDSAGKLIPGESFYGMRVLGLVEAGFPSPAEEELIDTMSFDEYLGADKESRFILRVKGESMRDEGIRPGDMVIVERSRNPKAGDIVIANIDGEWTMKYYRTQGKRAWLEAANSEFPPMVPEERLEIAAVVKAVVRSY